MSNQLPTKHPAHNSPQALFGAGIAIIFSVIAFIISLYDVFTQTNILFNSAAAWWLGVCTLTCLIFSAGMFAVDNYWLPILTLLIALLVAIIALVVAGWWLVLCACLIILGCIIQLVTQRQ